MTSGIRDLGCVVLLLIMSIWVEKKIREIVKKNDFISGKCENTTLDYPDLGKIMVVELLL